MNRILALLVLSALLFASGCACYTTTNAGGRLTIDIENSGWYLLSFIPLGSGNPDKPNRCSCRIFKNTVTLENNMKVLRQALVDCDTYKADNIVTHTSDEKVFFILLQRYVCHTSAELIKAYDDSTTCP